MAVAYKAAEAGGRHPSIRAEPPTTPEFPTAATVPFPFESPYDVQRELMDAILTALQQCQERQEDECKEDGEESTGNDPTAKRPRRAPIIMLESPTGTGKSLSLACASMAWLKYREGADIDELLPPKAEVVGEAVGGDDSTMSSPHGGNAKAVSPSPASLHNISKPKAKKYDWIDAWQPTDQQSNDTTK